MEQCRNCWAEIFILGSEGASSSGGASPRPLFHFIFLLLFCPERLGPLPTSVLIPIWSHHQLSVPAILITSSLKSSLYLNMSWFSNRNSCFLVLTYLELFIEKETAILRSLKLHHDLMYIIVFNRGQKRRSFTCFLAEKKYWNNINLKHYQKLRKDLHMYRAPFLHTTG